MARANTQRRSMGWVRFALSALGAACSDDGDTLENPSFDRWCDAGPCGWQVDEGVIRPTGTWHAEDKGVSFVSEQAQLSQLVQTSSVRCFQFDLLADVEVEARLVLRLNFNDDTTIDLEQQVPEVRWQRWPFIVAAPVDYNGVRFILRKLGEGRALVGQLSVERVNNCSGEPLTLLDDSVCRIDAVCMSGSCSAGRCGRCPESGCETPEAPE